MATAHLLKSFLEGHSLISKNSHAKKKNAMYNGPHIESLVLGSKERQSPGTNWPAHVFSLVSSRTMGDLVSKH